MKWSNIETYSHVLFDFFHSSFDDEFTFVVIFPAFKDLLFDPYNNTNEGCYNNAKLAQNIRLYILNIVVCV